MKKYSLCVFTVLLLLFSGCQPERIKEKRADISSFFNSINTSFSAQFDSFEAGGKISFTPEKLTLVFTSPKTVSGFEISVDNEKTTLSINDLTVTKQNSKITERFNATAVFRALNAARLTGVLSKADGKMQIIGEGCTVTLDGENRLSEIEIPEKRIHIKLEW